MGRSADTKGDSYRSARNGGALEADDRTSGQASHEQYTLLRKRLVEGEFPPGSLLQETAIAAEHGISRTPVRDALARLEQDGFLRRAPRGYRVRERSPEEVIDVYAVRISLESLAAELAAERWTVFDLRTLSDIHAETLRSTDVARLHELSGLFHEQISVASHNVMLQETLARMQRLMSMYGRHGIQQNDAQEVINSEHGMLLEAIARRDPVRAREMATSHLLGVRDRRVVAMLQ
jgi:DNA-binding GntR family transcriptional regulator